MSTLGTADNPLRVAIVGAGPTGFYTAERLFKEKRLVIEIDMLERLPTPFGLVRYGVAPDHQKIKSVTAAYDRIARTPGFRFFGNVQVGHDVTVDDLRRHYHQIVFTTGAQTDRALNIPGADLLNHHPATDFVAWYNGHPDFRDCHFDLSPERVAVIGVGNVAVDVCRILCRTPEELAKTDIADYALEALRHSQVKEVYMIGRRGPLQAAFTTPEIKELGEMADCDTFTLPEEIALDPLSQAALEQEADRATRRKVEIIQSYAGLAPTGKARRLYVRFLVSPVELYGDDTEHVRAMRLVHNELYATSSGSLQSRPTDQFEMLDVGLVFRSIGYMGVPVPGVPFHSKWGVILNEKGRVIDPDSQRPIAGEYTAGWIKRGPSGVIGTNKPDAAETVEQMLADVAEDVTLEPAAPTATAAEALIRERQPNYFSYPDWQRLDELEMARGQALGRPRLKFTSVAEMTAALGR